MKILLKILAVTLILQVIFACSQTPEKKIKAMIEKKQYVELLTYLETDSLPINLKSQVVDFFAQEAPTLECGKFAENNVKILSSEDLEKLAKTVFEQNDPDVAGYFLFTNVSQKTKDKLLNLLVESKNIRPIDCCDALKIFHDKISNDQKIKMIFRAAKSANPGDDIAFMISSLYYFHIHDKNRFTFFGTTVPNQELRELIIDLTLNKGTIKECEYLLKLNKEIEYDQNPYRLSLNQEMLIEDRIRNLKKQQNEEKKK